MLSALMEGRPSEELNFEITVVDVKTDTWVTLLLSSA